jgi:hypothetical protein
MIVFILSIQVCFVTWNCQWRPVGAFLDEVECRSIGREYAQDSTVSAFKCTIDVRHIR